MKLLAEGVDLDHLEGYSDGYGFGSAWRGDGSGFGDFGGVMTTWRDGDGMSYVVHSDYLPVKTMKLRTVKP